jgi:2-phospho-L-lactate guanylyltransferase
MPDTIAVLPIKRFAQAKQRLDRADRADVMRGMAERVLRALAASAIDRVLVVTGDAAAAQLARDHGAEVVDEPSLLGHSRAASLGVERAMALGARRVLLLPGDCPLMSAEAIDALLAAHAGPGVVVLPDRHGTGTNGLLLEPPDAIAPAFGPGSRRRHEELAAAAGARCVVDERQAFMFDVDTVDDLKAANALEAA